MSTRGLISCSAKLVFPIALFLVLLLSSEHTCNFRHFFSFPLPCLFAQLVCQLLSTVCVNHPQRQRLSLCHPPILLKQHDCTFWFPYNLFAVKDMIIIFPFHFFLHFTFISYLPSSSHTPVTPLFKIFRGSRFLSGTFKSLICFPSPVSHLLLYRAYV